MASNTDIHSCDILIAGSGAAGLTAALALADRYDVTVLSKSNLSAGSTAWAQGGIAAVLEEGDTFESHIADTMDAGAGLCRRETVEFVVERAPDAIGRLAQLGVAFNPGDDASHPFHLTREGGHSHRRIVHVNDATGWAVQTILEKAAAAHPRITLIEQHVGVDLITGRHVGGINRCHGMYVLDRRSNRVRRFLSRATILATGGASRVYLYATTPDGATGDGIAMAWRAGCRVANMEFNQFHPTCLYHSDVRNFLITEAVRGEGGHLKLPVTASRGGGARFMDRYDSRGELAPRDIVARAIDSEMKRLGLTHVDLDISHRDPDFIVGHFPTIYRRTAELGFDMTAEPIPVVPAAHYTCGGVLADLDGATDVPGLYAIGETAHSGLHGANRLASNSLLECLVFGEAAAADIARRIGDWSPVVSAPKWDESRVRDSDEEIVITHNWAELRQFMWDYVGIVRTNKRLERARHRVDLLMRESQDYYGNFRVTRDLLELRNLVTVAGLIVECALHRHESRGLHFSTDYPGQLPEALDTILVPPAIVPPA